MGLLEGPMRNLLIILGGCVVALGGFMLIPSTAVSDQKLVRTEYASAADYYAAQKGAAYILA